MSRNDELFARAQRTIPAGVNSPVRAFRSVGGTPRFFERGRGAYVANETIVLPYNDLAAVDAAFARDGADIACIIVEPIAGNMNLIMPKTGFLQGLRDVCNRYGSVLIFDEVMTGFRVHPRGVQGLLGVTPDLTTLGKVIGGGMPVGAFGGKRVIMEKIAPLGPVYQAGTLSGNPVAVAAGLATLKEIQAAGFYDALAATTKSLADGLTAAANRAGVAFSAQSVGGMFGIYFANHVPSSYDSVMAADKARFNRFFHAMLEEGVYFAPSAFEAGFVSAAHTTNDIAATIAAAEKAFSAAR
jgi:glutamate-1-semialdehyde 2,1-aminomutase